MSEIPHYKFPRLYVDQPLEGGRIAILENQHAHYLKNVLRKNEGDYIRLFNGRDGEWIATLQNLKKKSGEALLKEHITKQPAESAQIHLIFAPIRKNRMDFLIEKAVELGVDHLHPVLTARTEMRKINEERIQAQIIEAAEQCERLTLPTLHPIKNLSDIVTHWSLTPQIYWAAERENSDKISPSITPPAAFLIGPEGGFDQDECRYLSGLKHILPVSLGERILRAETAALYCLAQLR